MKQLAKTELMKLKTEEFVKHVPCEITSDGIVIAEVRLPGRKVKTKCPNCKFEYDAVEPDGLPPYFTMRHSQG